jgi:Kef-type K+ transport system membrane component KefB
LFLTGLESDLDELVAVGGQATTVAVAGVLLPFALGTAGLMGLFHVDVIPAVFAGASMTATSIGITASVFGELKMLRSREGQIVIGAAVLDDILGIVILAVVVSLAGGGNLDVGPILKLVAAAIVFVVAAIGLSRTAAPGFDWLIDRLKAPGDVVVASFVVLTLCCFAATAIGLEAALGAFAAGLILSKSGLVRHDLLRADRHRHGPFGAQPPRSRQSPRLGGGRLPAGGGHRRQGGGRLVLRFQRTHPAPGGGAGDDAPR